MNVTIISSVIAFSGVLISVIISFLSNRKLLKTELEKIEVNIEQNYASKLLEKRLDFYPHIYELISDIAKKARKLKEGLNDEGLRINEVKIFTEKYNKLNSKYGVVFSSSSSGCSYKMRLFLIKLLKNYQEEKQLISKEDVEKLRRLISDLEFSLKQDLGVFLVEFQDAKRELSLNEYDDVIKEREKRRKNTAANKA